MTILKAVGIIYLKLPVPEDDKRCFQTKDLTRTSYSLCVTHPASLHHTFRLNLAAMFKNAGFNFQRKHFNKLRNFFLLFLPVNITQNESGCVSYKHTHTSACAFI